MRQWQWRKKWIQPFGPRCEFHLVLVCCVIWGRWLQPPEKNVRQKVYQDYLQVCVCVCVCVLVTHSYLTFCDPMNCSPSGSSVHGILKARILGVSCHSLLQGIFPTQGLNLGPLHCRWILYCLNHQGSPTYRCRTEKYSEVTISTKVYFYHLSFIIREAGEKSLFLSLLGCIQFLWLYL